jgi:hypothetical protein
MVFESFVVSETTYRQIKDLPPDQKLRFYDAIMEFGLYDKSPSFTGVELSAWIPMHDLIQNAKDKRAEYSERQRQKAQKRWHSDDATAYHGNADDATACTGISGNADDAYNGNGNGNVNVNGNGKSSPQGGSVPQAAHAPSRRFTPPSSEEVRAYCSERHNSVDPVAFCDFYSAKGWMIGTSKMKDWKAAVRTWERRENKQAATEDNGRNFGREA